MAEDRADSGAVMIRALWLACNKLSKAQSPRIDTTRTIYKEMLDKAKAQLRGGDEDSR